MMTAQRINVFLGRAITRLAYVIGLSIACCLAANAVDAKPPPAFSTFDPAAMFERMFGAQSTQQREKLAKIPISWTEEQRFGAQAAKAFLESLRQHGIKVLARGRDVDYLQQLIQVIRPRMKNAQRYRHIKVYVADSDDTDARCFPGGTIVVFRGMLEFAGSEAAMVGVLGHELSHLDHGHQLTNLRAMKLAQQTFRPGPHGVNFAEMMNNGFALVRLFAHPFRPEDEMVADRDGAMWAYQTGYDPREMANLFLRLHRRDRGRGDQVPMFLRTHPYRMERYKMVMRLYQQLQAQDPKTNLYIGRTNLKRRIPRAEHRFKD